MTTANHKPGRGGTGSSCRRPSANRRAERKISVRTEEIKRQGADNREKHTWGGGRGEPRQPPTSSEPPRKSKKPRGMEGNHTAADDTRKTQSNRWRAAAGSNNKQGTANRRAETTKRTENKRRRAVGRRPARNRNHRNGGGGGAGSHRQPQWERERTKKSKEGPKREGGEPTAARTSPTQRSCGKARKIIGGWQPHCAKAHGADGKKPQKAEETGCVKQRKSTRGETRKGSRQREEQGHGTLSWQGAEPRRSAK